MIPAPAPGRYFNVPAETYFSWAAVSNSELTEFAKSPAHAKAFREGLRSKDTPSTTFGTLAHFALLQPDEFDSRHAVAGQCEELTAKGARCSNMGSVRSNGHWLCGVHGKSAVPDPVAAVSAEHHAACLRIRDNASKIPKLRFILEHVTDTEVCSVWEWVDVTTGETVLCKARADMLCPVCETIPDLKTTTCASREAFAKSVFEWGYHRQAAHYTEGFQLPGFCHVVAERDYPNLVAFYELSPRALGFGEAEREALLRRYLRCQSLNDWPGYPEDIQTIELPDWAERQIERTLNAA